MNENAEIATVKTGRQWDRIKGSIADAIRERIERIDARVQALNDHLVECPDCQTALPPYRLCGTGNRLLMQALDE